MSDPPIFIVGCPRSGTSLFRDLVRSHRRIAIPPESHFIPRFWASWGDPGSDAEAKALARRILSLKTVRRWELDAHPAEFASCRSFAEVLDALFGRFAAAEGKERWGDKTPHHVAELPALASLFPDGRFIHIYRDPRDVAMSWSTKSFGPGNVYGAALGWRRYVGAGHRDGPLLGDRYMEVRYETLVSRTEQTMRSVAEFLGEDYHPEITRRAWRSHIYGPNGRGSRRDPEVNTATAFRWKRAMPTRDRATVESIAGEQMKELGYELEGLAKPIRLPSRAWQSTLSNAGLARKRLSRRELSLANGVLMARAGLRARLSSRH